MSQTINRMYESHARASEAADALRNRGPEVYFKDVFVTAAREEPARAVGAVPVGAVPAGAVPAGAVPSGDGIVAALTGAYVLESHARVYADGIRRGAALVTVHAPFGCARTAISILEDFGPIDAGITEVREPPRGYDEATPLSSVFGWRVLLDGAAPFSRFWNLPVLSRSGATTSTRLGLPELVGSGDRYRPTLPLPLLSHNAAPLSSKLGLPLLSGNAAPLSSKLGLPVLSHNAAPLSSKLGLPVLTRSR